MNIVFVCRSFNNMAGGVENMAITLMNEMVSRGHDISLITWDAEGAESFYGMDDRIKWHKINLGSHLKKAGLLLKIKRALKVRRMVKTINPDIIIAFQHGCFISFRLFLTMFDLPIIAAERNAISRLDHTSSGKKKWLILQSFRLADKITVQLPDYIGHYPKYLRHKMVCIENPVKPARLFAKAGENDKTNIILCVGRLSFQKNQTALIKAFSMIHKKFVNWQLVLVGEGEDRRKLESLIDKLNLKGRVILKGNVKNTASFYSKAKLFVLPSRWEGFPNVIAEAMSHGLPCIGFNGCDGTNILIKHEENGLLAAGNGDYKTLSNSIEYLIMNPKSQKLFAKRALKDMEYYQPKKIFDRWEELFKQCVKK